MLQDLTEEEDPEEEVEGLGSLLEIRLLRQQ
jgi:hypothetical protein